MDQGIHYPRNEALTVWITDIPKWMLQDDRGRQKTDDEFVHIYSVDRLKIAANILEVSVAVMMLLIPVYLLFLVEMSKPMMATVASIFVCLFTVVVASVTGAKVQEVLFGCGA